MKEIVIFLATLLPSLIAGGFTVFIFQREKIKSIENQLSQKKYDVYYKFITLIYEIQKRSKFNEKQFTDRESYLKIIEIKKDLIFYGSDPVVHAFFQWEYKGRENVKDFKYVFRIITEMRKDMGNKSSTINHKVLEYNLRYNPNEPNNGLA